MAGITVKEYEAMGRLTVHFEQAIYFMRDGIEFMIDRGHEAARIMLGDKPGAGRVIKFWRALADSTALYSNECVDALRMAKEIAEIQNERNNYVHAFWFTGVGKAMRRTGKGNVQMKDIKLEELEGWAEKAEMTAKRIGEFVYSYKTLRNTDKAGGE